MIGHVGPSLPGVPTYRRFLVGEATRFSQKNIVYARLFWDAEMVDEMRKFKRNSEQPHDRPGDRGEDLALRDASWYGDDVLAPQSSLGFLSRGFYNGLNGWEPPAAPSYTMPPGFRLPETDPARNADLVKKAARLFGADLVGVCEVNPAWIYSHVLDVESGEERQLELPEGCLWAVVVAVEEDYAHIRMSPTAQAGAAVGMGYSRMAFTAGLLGQYIRNLGYKAVPAGNDTALSVPLAVDAGLGELGRFGLLITKEYGPRVRLCKVFTDLPLAPDRPVDLGVQAFCEECKKCARACPSKAIPEGGRTAEPHNISNNGGMLKWMVDAERCFRYWAAKGTDCGLCRSVCPWNKPNTGLHRVVSSLARTGRPTRRALLWADDVFYGRQ